jgi:hypothetical protein
MSSPACGAALPRTGPAVENASKQLTPFLDYATLRPGESYSSSTRSSPSTPAIGERSEHAGTSRTSSPLKCLYPVTRSLGAIGRGSTRWTTRWKPALNVFATPCEGRLTPKSMENLRTRNTEVWQSRPRTHLDAVADRRRSADRIPARLRTADTPRRARAARGARPRLRLPRRSPAMSSEPPDTSTAAYPPRRAVDNVHLHLRDDAAPNAHLAVGRVRWFADSDRTSSARADPRR